MKSILLAIGAVLTVSSVVRAEFYAPYVNWGVENRLGVERGDTTLDHNHDKLRVHQESSRSLHTFTEGDTTYSGLRSRDRTQVGKRRVSFNGEGRITGWSTSNSPLSHGFGSVEEVSEDEENLPLGGEELKLNFDFEGL